MNSGRTWIVALLALAVGAGGGYLAGRRSSSGERPAGAAAGSDRSATIATFAGGTVTADELRAAIDEQGAMARSELSSPAGRKRLTLELVRQKLIERDAAAKEYDRTPDYVREQRRALAGLYLRKELEEPSARRSPTDEQLQAFLDKHRAEYEQPERVRIADIFIAAPADPDARKKKLAEAQALLDKLRKSKDYYAFANAARRSSDDPATKVFGGDLPLLGKAELESQLGHEVAEAAFALRGSEVLAERVLASPKGFHLVKLRTRVEATHPDFASLRGMLRTRAAAELRGADEQKLFDALLARSDVSINEAALLAVPLPQPAAPVKTASRPGP
jgi:parvulin-like peptidyl-prolyl isomerase